MPTSSPQRLRARLAARTISALAAASLAVASPALASSQHAPSGIAASAHSTALSLSSSADAEAASVSGRAVDPISGEGVAGVAVSAYRAEGVASEVQFVLEGSAITGEDGSYSIPDLPEGRYDLLFDPSSRSDLAWRWREGGPAAASQPTTVLGTESVDLGDTTMEPANAISGRVTAARTGGALAGASVTLTALVTQGETTGFVDVGSTTTDATGDYLIDRLPAGRYALRFTPASASYAEAYWGSPGGEHGYTAVDLVGGGVAVADQALLSKVNLGTVGVSGKAVSGYTLTAKHNNYSGTVYTYKWYREGCAMPCVVGTQRSLRLDYYDDGDAFRVEVTGSKPGVVSTTQSSPASLRVMRAGPVWIDGKSAVTQANPSSVYVGSTLVADRTPWTAAATKTYQWFADGVEIPGATAKSYTLTTGELYKRVTVRVTGRLEGFGTAVRTSPPTATIARVGLPYFAGSTKPRVGVPITISHTAWTPGATMHYQWYAGGSRITGATGKTFVPTSAQVGMQLSVRVAGSKKYYISHAFMSAKTSAVTH